MKKEMKVTIMVVLVLNGAISTSQVMTPEVRSNMLARAAKLELKTTYKPPPGDALSLHTAGYAKIMCSAVFITGLTPAFAAEHVGYFKGSVNGEDEKSLNKAYTLLMEAVPEKMK